MDTILDLPVFDIFAGSKITNHHTGINMDENSEFINDGLLTFIDSDGGFFAAGEAIDLDDANSHFINNGVITITNIEFSESIEIDGTFDNNGLINMGNGSASQEIIKVEATGIFNNNFCGVVNITTAHLLENNGQFNNNWIISIHDCCKRKGFSRFRI